MKRRDYRMLALQALFALEMNPVAPAAAMASVIHEFGNISEKDQAFLIQLIDGVWSPIKIDLDVIEANRFLADTLYDHRPRRALAVGEGEKITVYECHFEEMRK